MSRPPSLSAAQKPIALDTAETSQKSGSESVVNNDPADFTPERANKPPIFMRRKQASAYLVQKYGFGAVRTLAKAAVEGGGPEYHKAGRIVLYTREALDAWALAKIGAARRSTSDQPEGA